MKLISTKMIKSIEFLFMKVRKIHTSDSIKKQAGGVSKAYILKRQIRNMCVNNGKMAEIFYSIRGYFSHFNFVPQYHIFAY